MSLELITPEETLRYEHDWQTWLGQGSLQSSSWSITPAGPTLSDELNDTRYASVFVAGCTFGVSYRLTNTVTDDDGEEASRSIFLECGRR